MGRSLKGIWLCFTDGLTYEIAGVTSNLPFKVFKTGYPMRLSSSFIAILALIAWFPAGATIPNPAENCRCGATARRAVCPQDVPSTVKYRPASSLCGGKAAILLQGPFLNSFSVVVRDSQNRDRWPAAGSGYGGCGYTLANSKAPPRRCSSFKAAEESLREWDNDSRSLFPREGQLAVLVRCSPDDYQGHEFCILASPFLP